MNVEPHWGSRLIRVSKYGIQLSRGESGGIVRRASERKINQLRQEDGVGEVKYCEEVCCGS